MVVYAQPALPTEADPLVLGDRVRVSSGREGEVIGFFRRRDESVLVAFSPRESAEFLTPDVTLVS
jgi:hypothetical protein